jgi:hypothetical protein
MRRRQRPRGSPSRDDTQANRNKVGRTQEITCRKIRFHLSVRYSRLTSAPGRVCDSAMKDTTRKNAGNSIAKRPRGDFSNPVVDAVFKAYPKPLRARLLALRRLIFDTARTTKGVGALQETLKWGQPSYLTPQTKSGSTIRIDQVKSAANLYALYFHCQTDLVETFRELYPSELSYGGNRSILLNAQDEIPRAALRHCVALALTYHLNKRKPARMK